MENLSICIIAKNEENKIGRCLESLSPLDAEIIVIDTGSSDRTKEIAAKYTNCIYDFEWVKDFSAARNFSIEKASNDWILILDCDEWIIEYDATVISAFMKSYPKFLGTLERRDLLNTEDNSSYTCSNHFSRFFNKNFFHYEGSIHEQITPFDKTMSLSFETTSIIALHDGYAGSDEEIYHKRMRNISMLQERLRKEPDNPHMMVQLAQTHYALKDYETALNWYSKAREYPVDYSQPLGQELAWGWINCLNELGRSAEALAILPYYNQLKEYADFVLLMGHVYANQGQYLKAMAEYLSATTIPKCRREGANTYLPFYHIGNIYAALGDKNMAKMMYLKCGDFADAQNALRQL